MNVNASLSNNLVNYCIQEMVVGDFDRYFSIKHYILVKKYSPQNSAAIQTI